MGLKVDRTECSSSALIRNLDRRFALPVAPTITSRYPAQYGVQCRGVSSVRHTSVSIQSVLRPCYRVIASAPLVLGTHSADASSALHTCTGRAVSLIPRQPGASVS